MGFQCSSASRKFLNSGYPSAPAGTMFRFSALQRAENSSIDGQASQHSAALSFSALQRAENSSIEEYHQDAAARDDVSVLFSEPKIPQSCNLRYRPASQRPFQCSSASRKFLNSVSGNGDCANTRVSVLFSEPKIPQWCHVSCVAPRDPRFQCSSASRKFLNSRTSVPVRLLPETFQCSSASRKFLNCERNRIASTQLIGFSALQRAENSSMICRGMDHWSAI